MKIDLYGCMIMEETEDPGNLGDSCAETSRFAILCAFVDYDGNLLRQIRLASFVTNEGFLRHPNAPDGPPRSKDSWREVDASSDQVLPLYFAAWYSRPSVERQIRERICETMKVNPTTYASVGLYCVCKGWMQLFQWSMVIQALLFKIPFRWDDSVAGFRSSKGSSADYLNFFMCMAFLHLRKQRSWANAVIKLLIKKETILEMIRHYYRNEPHSDWLVEMYEHAIGEVYQ